MSEETAEYRVRNRNEIRDVVEVLKQATLYVLYSARNYGPLQLTAIREQLGIQKGDENSDARDNSLVYCILTHLQNDGYVSYHQRLGWKIAEKGVLAIEKVRVANLQ